MIEVIEGRGVGAGKSYFAIDRLMPHWIRGGTACVSDSVVINWAECKRYAERRAGVVLEDDQYRCISSDDLQRLHEVTPPGSPELPVQIIVDEAQDAFNARDFGEGMKKGQNKRSFFSWLCQSRHDDNDVVILSQAAANVDKQVRRLCTYIWIVRNTEYFPVGGKPLAFWIKLISCFTSDGRFFVRTQLDQDGKTKLGRQWIKADRELFRCYESKAMRMKHRRSGDAVARKKLAKVQNYGRNKMFKYALVGAACAILFGGYQLFHGGGWFSHSKQAGGKGGAAPIVVASPAHYDGEIVAEELRAYSDGYLQTAKHIYEPNQRNDLGMCIAVNRDRAVVEHVKGVFLYVQAYSCLPVAAAPSASPSGSLLFANKK